MTRAEEPGAWDDFAWFVPPFTPGRHTHTGFTDRTRHKIRGSIDRRLSLPGKYTTGEPLLEPRNEITPNFVDPPPTGTRSQLTLFGGVCLSREVESRAGIVEETCEKWRAGQTGKVPSGPINIKLASTIALFIPRAPKCATVRSNDTTFPS